MLQNITKKVLLVLFAGLMSFSSFSQGMKERTADKYYKQLAFIKAGEMYGELAKKSDATDHQIRRAAESYRFIGDAVNSETYYEILSKHSGVKPKDFYYYAQMLKINEKYKKADSVMAKFGTLEGSNSIPKAHASYTDYETDLKSQPDKYIIAIMDINTDKSDFGPNYYSKNGERNLTFASARKNMSLYNKKFQWDGSSFLDVYKVKIGGDGENAGVEKFVKDVKSRYHEGPVSFSNNGTKMYLTRSNYIDRKTGTDTEQQNNLKLYLSEKDSAGNWSELTNFQYNDDEYSLGHATVTEDGNTMYFTSDMPGGKGITDIWMSEFKGGKWGTPVNVADVNTEGREMFPYIGEAGTLYFSSDAYAGLGGLDIYRATSKNKNGEFDKPENMMYPLNTNHDDFAMIIDKDEKEGYFSSNRDGFHAQGNDDIYRFKMVTPFKSKYYIVKGCARTQDGDVVAGTTIKLINTETGELYQKLLSETGCYTFYDVPKGVYKVEGNKPGWETIKNYTFDTDDAKKDQINNADVILKEPKCGLVGTVADAVNNEPLSGVKVTITDKATGEVKTFMTDGSGKFEDELANVPCPGGLLDYEITFEKEGFFPKTVNFNHAIIQPGIINLNEFLGGGFIKIQDVGGFCQINSILYDFDKSFIRPDAAAELDKLVACMKANPEMVVEIGSHTDCRAKNAYNVRLATRRAKAARKYVIKKGISGKRIYGKGYGEFRLLKDCPCEPTNESSCSEELHQLNRRTEFRIVRGGEKIFNKSTNSFDK